MSDESQNGVQPTGQAEGNEPLEQNDVEFSDDERNSWDEDFSKKVDSLSAQKKHFRSKYEKAAAEAEELRQQLAQFQGSKEEKPAAPKTETKAELLERIERTELKMQYPDLSLEQIDKARKWATAEGVDTNTFIQSPEFQAILGAQKDQSERANAAPNPSNRSGSSSPDYDNMSPDAIRNMSNEEYEKYQEHMAKTGGSAGLRIRPRTGL